MLYVDIPTLPEVQKLFAARHTPSVSLYLPTSPDSGADDSARTRLGQLFKKAEEQLSDADTAKRTLWPLEEHIEDLIEDDDFWAHQANSLAVFLTPQTMRTFRLPSHLTEAVQVSDRFFLKPLLRAVSVPQHAFVLALEENDVRLIEVTADLPAAEVRVPALPRDAASANNTASVNSRSASGRIQGGEGQKVLLRNYARQIDAALRPVLARPVRAADHRGDRTDGVDLPLGEQLFAPGRRGDRDQPRADDPGGTVRPRPADPGHPARPDDFRGARALRHP
jgi:hypothetical protein